MYRHTHTSLESRLSSVPPKPPARSGGGPQPFIGFLGAKLQLAAKTRASRIFGTPLEFSASGRKGLAANSARPAPSIVTSRLKGTAVPLPLSSVARHVVSYAARAGRALCHTNRIVPASGRRGVPKTSGRTRRSASLRGVWDSAAASRARGAKLLALMGLAPEATRAKATRCG